MKEMRKTQKSGMKRSEEGSREKGLIQEIFGSPVTSRLQINPANWFVPDKVTK